MGGSDKENRHLWLLYADMTYVLYYVIENAQIGVYKYVLIF